MKGSALLGGGGEGEKHQGDRENLLGQASKIIIYIAKVCLSLQHACSLTGQPFTREEGSDQLYIAINVSICHNFLGDINIQKKEGAKPIIVHMNTCVQCIIIIIVHICTL